VASQQSSAAIGAEIDTMWKGVSQILLKFLGEMPVKNGLSNVVLVAPGKETSHVLGNSTVRVSARLLRLKPQRKALLEHLQLHGWRKTFCSYIDLSVMLYQ
jgi:hypothetical protein